MPRFAANLSMMFTEWSFLDRFAAAADAGFSAVEYLFPYEHAPDEIGARLARHGLTQALFNLPPGDWAAGERGFAARPGLLDKVEAGLEQALPYVEATGVRRLHLMAGLADSNDPRNAEAFETAVVWTSEALADRGVNLVLEPINKRDMPGYFLNDFDSAGRLIRRLDRPNLKLQFDLYHRQILHGDVLTALGEMMAIIGHVQVASVPARAEPGTGELNDTKLFEALDSLGYEGFVGCEYRPAAGTLDGLSWFEPYRREGGGGAS